MFQQKYLGFEGGLRYESTPFVRQYYQFFKVKIYSGTDKLKTTKRQLERYIFLRKYAKSMQKVCSIYLSSCLKVVWKLSVPEYILTLKIDSTEAM